MAASPHAKSRRNHFAGYRVSTQTSLRDALLTGTDRDGKENRILFLCRRRLQKSQNLSSSSKKRFFFFVFFFVVIVIAKTTMTPALLSVVVVVVFRETLSSSSLVVIGVVVDSKPKIIKVDFTTKEY